RRQVDASAELAHLEWAKHAYGGLGRAGTSGHVAPFTCPSDRYGDSGQPGILEGYAGAARCTRRTDQLTAPVAARSRRCSPQPEQAMVSSAVACCPPAVTVPRQLAWDASPDGETPAAM